jgi:hypothetical protein
MSRPLRILFTNITLASRTGTEVYIKEAALGMLRRGHTPLVYSPDLGEIAEKIRGATIPVVDDLSRLGAPPDVIHGHHHQQAMTALMHFPGVPGIFTTHDWAVWHWRLREKLVRFPGLQAAYQTLRNPRAKKSQRR